MLESIISRLSEALGNNNTDGFIVREKQSAAEIEFNNDQRLNENEYEETLNILRYEKRYEILNDAESIFYSAELIMEAFDDYEDICQAVKVLDENKYIAFIIYYRNYESAFRSTLFQRLETFEETKRLKILKMLDNVKDGQDY